MISLSGSAGLGVTMAHGQVGLRPQAGDRLRRRLRQVAGWTLPQKSTMGKHRHPPRRKGRADARHQTMGLGCYH
ncbi:MAG: hypothetical protein II336_06420 [Loktanella sp.]|nr:hypothetical protein [Loktanella sp.]